MVHIKVEFGSGHTSILIAPILTKGSVRSQYGDKLLPICIVEGTYNERDKRGKSLTKTSLFYMPSSPNGIPIGKWAIMPNEFLNGTTTQPYRVIVSGIDSEDDTGNIAFKTLCTAFRAQCLSVPVGDENYLLAQQMLAKMASDGEAKEKRLREEKSEREINALVNKVRNIEFYSEKKVVGEAIPSEK